MDNVIVISGLTRKRAVLAGEIIAAEKHTQKLRDDLTALDATIRLFDPEFCPTRARTITKRRMAVFKSGELTRAILNTLREKGAPMSAREIAEAVAASHGVDVDNAAKISRFTNHINTALVRDRPDVVREGWPGDYTWRLG